MPRRISSGLSRWELLRTVAQAAVPTARASKTAKAQDNRRCLRGGLRASDFEVSSMDFCVARTDSATGCRCFNPTDRYYLGKILDLWLPLNNDGSDESISSLRNRLDHPGFSRIIA